MRLTPLCLLVGLLYLSAGAEARQTGYVITASDARIYYEVHAGNGEDRALTPVAFIAGLGAAGWLWEHQVSAVSAARPVIVFDNRGAGRSDAPAGPYTIEQMAGDLLVVLDELGVERAHLVGASMGGLIAQEFALTYPDRVADLVLVATTAGGPNHEPMSADVAVRFLLVHEDPREHIRMRLPLAFSEGFLADETVVDRMIETRLERPQSPEAYQAQALAGAAFDASSRLDQISARTLVIHASGDLLVPVVNAERLADGIPDARLTIYEEPLGHLFFAEVPDRFNTDLLDFIADSEHP